MLVPDDRAAAPVAVAGFPAWQSPADRARVPLPSDVPALSIIVLPLALEDEGFGNEWLVDGGGGVQRWAEAFAIERAELALDQDCVRAWPGIQFTTATQWLNGWTDDPAATWRRTDDALANLPRVDRDGGHTCSAKAFRLCRQRDFPAMLRVTTEWTERYRLALAHFGAGRYELARGWSQTAAHTGNARLSAPMEGNSRLL